MSLLRPAAARKRMRKTHARRAAGGREGRLREGLHEEDSDSLSPQAAALGAAGPEGCAAAKG